MAAPASEFEVARLTAHQVKERLDKGEELYFVDVRRHPDDSQPVGQDAIAWAKKCQELGAGVLLPTSMDGDGTLAGYDLEFTRAVSDVVDVPVVASGGAGKLEHFYEGVIKGGAQILLAASVFHFRTLSIRQVKEYLKQRGLKVAL